MQHLPHPGEERGVQSAHRSAHSHGDLPGRPWRRWRFVAPLIAVTGLLGLPSAAGAASQTFAPIADARVEQAHPTSNYGRSSTLRVDGGTDPRVETFLRFKVGGLSGAPQRARLRLYTTSGTILKPVAFSTGASWSEGGITWNTRPGRTTALLGETGSVAAGTWVEFDATPVVSAEGTYDFLLATTSTDGLNMASRESSSPRPELVVDVASTPPASTLAPSVSGTAQEGQKLSVTTGSWSGSTPMTYNYRWRRCGSSGTTCADIAGAAANTYVTTSADVGATLRAAVTASNAAGSATASSAATAAVSVAPAPLPAPAPTPAGGAGGAVGVPSSGAWLGAWTSPNTGFTVDQREAQLGRRYRIVHRYHGWGEVFPEPNEVSWAQAGRTLYLAWDARVFSTNTPVSWASIANGSQDAVIDAQADRVRAFGQPLFMDFSQEPEAEVDDGRYGTVAEFAAAYRHIVQRFRARGATNVAWVWSVMGYSGYYSYYTGGLYPGDDVIDWIGWDPYNWYLCHGSAWKSFAEKVSGFYNWLGANGHADKPFMLSEFGSRENDLDPLAKGQWFRDALATLKAGTFPKLKALVYFDSQPTECNWRVDTGTPSLDGYRQFVNDPYLNP